MRQDPSISDIKTEQDIIELLRNVRNDLDGITPGIAICREPLSKIAGYVEQGSYNAPRRPIDSEVDLSEARNLLQKYKFLSQDGCFSCQHRVGFHSAPDEVNDYCGKYEKREDAMVDFGKSPRVKQYLESGCAYRVPIFRKLEEVLKDIKEDK